MRLRDIPKAAAKEVIGLLTYAVFAASVICAAAIVTFGIGALVLSLIAALIPAAFILLSLMIVIELSEDAESIEDLLEE